MRSARWISFLALGLAAALLVNTPARAQDGDGLNLPGAVASPVWSRWHSRVALSLAEPAYRPLGPAASSLKLRSFSVMGDYYFGAAAIGTDSQGFRATSGLMIGNRASWSLADAAALGAGGRSFSLDRRDRLSLSVPTLPGADAGGETSAVPYVGVGYTGAWARSGWGFSADLGLMALNPGSAVKLGRVLGGTQSLDDMLRELRLSPVLQLGVSYSF